MIGESIFKMKIESIHHNGDDPFVLSTFSNGLSRELVGDLQKPSLLRVVKKLRERSVSLARRWPASFAFPAKMAK